MNRTFVYIALLLAIVLSPLIPRTAKANVVCPYSQMYYFSPATINVPANAAVGSVIGTVSASFPDTGDYAFTYCSGVDAYGSANLGIRYIGARTPLGGNLYDTGIPGVAYRVSSSSMDCSQGLWPISCPYLYYAMGWYPRTIKVELIKTGPIPAGGTWSGDIAYTQALSSSGAVTTTFMTYRWSGPLVIVPSNPSCTVSTPNVSVNLGTMSAAGAVGATSNPVDFNLKLSCTAGSTAGASTNVYVTVTDSTNPGNRTNTMKLASGSTATGVGIQVLWNGTPVTFGADSSTIGNAGQWLAASTTGADVTIPLKGRYIKTLSTATAGTANGVATFTIAYN